MEQQLNGSLCLSDLGVETGSGTLPGDCALDGKDKDEVIERGKSLVENVVKKCSIKTYRNDVYFRSSLIELKDIYYHLKHLAGEKTKNFQWEVQRTFLETGFVSLLCGIVGDYLTTDWLLAKGKANPDVFDGFYLALLTLFYLSESTPVICATSAAVPGFVKLIGEQLTRSYNKLSSGEVFTEQDDTVTRRLLGLTKNCSFVPEAKTKQREEGYIAVLVPYVGAIVEKYKMSAILSLVNIVDEEEDDVLEAGVDTVDFLLSRLGTALETPGRRSMGYSVKELAHAITKLAKNDVNAKTLVARGALPVLINLLYVEDKEEQREAAEALWGLSFEDENKVKMAGDSRLLKRITELMTSADQAVKDAVQGIQWNLRNTILDPEPSDGGTTDGGTTDGGIRDLGIDEGATETCQFSSYERSVGEPKRLLREEFIRFEEFSREPMARSIQFDQEKSVVETRRLLCADIICSKELSPEPMGSSIQFDQEKSVVEPRRLLCEDIICSKEFSPEPMASSRPIQLDQVDIIDNRGESQLSSSTAEEGHQQSVRRGYLKKQAGDVIDYRSRSMSGGSTGGLGLTEHVMISYQWDSQETVLKIRDELKSQGYRVWLDVDNMAGSTLEAMARAVEDSAVVLICMSRSYKKSLNCRAEAEYTFNRRVAIIPLLMEKGYKPNGWLGMLLGAKLYYDFSGRYSFQTKMQELVKELGTKGLDERKISHQRIRKESVDVLDSVEEIDAQQTGAGVNLFGKEWKQKDVTEWFKARCGDKPALTTLTSKHVVFLRGLKREAPETFYSLLRENLGLTSIEDLMNFVEALKTLK